jgi:pyridoxamine 5'-phosphate oxidase
MSESDPITRFNEWFELARVTESSDPTAMALATAASDGSPSVRMVLLKQADQDGFVFYTNLESPKCADLRNNPRAALCFHWPKLERQVRIEGSVRTVAEVDADEYFATRPRLSQLGAWASRQSQPIAGRLVLKQAVAAVALRFPSVPSRARPIGQAGGSSRQKSNSGTSARFATTTASASRGLPAVGLRNGFFPSARRLSSD